MIDIAYIREHQAELKTNIKNRGLTGPQFDVDEFLKIDRKRSEMMSHVETLRARRNQLSSGGAGGDAVAIERGRQIKLKLKKLEAEFKKIEKLWQDRMNWMPNLTHPAMPVGKSEADNLELKNWGEAIEFKFKAKNHLELGEALDLIDVKKSGVVAGSRFYYLKNEAALMQWGIFDLMLKRLISQGFTLLITPVILKYLPLYGTGYFPSEEDQVYELKVGQGKIEDEERRFLAGTSEQAIVAYHMGDVLEISDDKPQKYVGLSTCFRSEAGSWGRDVRGIKRVHQFDKVEMIYLTTPATSQKYMQEALELEEWILQQLGLPYRVMEMCTGEVGLATYRKFDLEVWLPSQAEWMETHSNSDLASYHARRLNIKYKKADGKKDFVHTISATAITNTRPIAAILDNYQKEDGSVEVPEVLQSYVGKPKIGG